MATRVLEVAANSLDSALAAQAGGAGRIELCTALELGGLTPSHGEIALVREHVRLPLYVLIRPRAGDFLYSEHERATMRRDIEACAALGCDGVVFGVLDADGDVDMDCCSELAAAAGRMGITFHRAFDLVRDPERALEDLISLRAERVLTSGGARSALEGAERIRERIAQAHGRLVVMPGAGITPANIAHVAALTGADELHASAKRGHPSGMAYQPDDTLGMAGGEIRTDEDEVRALMRAWAAA
ncbi:copper homeostasis protein CutC [Dyella amyloliquefaciens]|uniref:copper homeostasis protein CutC n=1 Tax=Dyella amyloliquefaciens TaxID=1770545 RepID=UPI00102E5B45|nr:copper homeostasis protein CutC [Dyella amyloliquefaciens]